ncbi:hypothetical protein CNBJ3040 [Cryptococcus deneoformans B-3501A]|uniref:hypothetical protein n=1 Tax=Cryptococcus deneoformans (strain B-3501A) TaxID=283643 RepID=UPI000042DACA|nr:hypothetical protein CNBJ3040 [Cryptococcus neoformans var. neoformans B-3501A]EAL18381.1 hypothetical protein CNBJ3040 [Cryptococcus neoformans var. neoformans B-3501A]
MFSSEIARMRKLGVQGFIPYTLSLLALALCVYMLFQALNLLTVVASGLMMWKGLCLFTNSESPIVVVLSGSMEPAFYRGDILFLINPTDVPYEVGDITVYKVPGSEIPIVHRVIESHTTNTTQLLLTKGDNNPGDDVVLYNGLQWIERRHIIGKVRGFLPYVGYVTIAMVSPTVLHPLYSNHFTLYQERLPATQVCAVGYHRLSHARPAGAIAELESDRWT